MNKNIKDQKGYKESLEIDKIVKEAQRKVKSLSEEDIDLSYDFKNQCSYICSSKS